MRNVKSFYNQYVEKIVLDETEFCNHDFLFKYWESCKSSHIHGGEK